MTYGVYHSRQRTVTAVQWAEGMRAADLAGILDGTMVTARPGFRTTGTIVLREPGLEDRVVRPGMWIIRDSGIITTSSSRAFTAGWTKAPDDTL